MAEIERGEAPACVQRGMMRDGGLLIHASPAALWEGMLGRFTDPLVSSSAGVPHPLPISSVLPMDACKPAAFPTRQALLPFLPSVPLFITPPCTVKPPVTLPLLLLLQIYCTCRVKWWQWQGPAFFPPSPRDSLKSSPSFAFTWSCCAAYEIGRFICYLAWCLITL